MWALTSRKLKWTACVSFGIFWCPSSGSNQNQVKNKEISTLMIYSEIPKRSSKSSCFKLLMGLKIKCAWLISLVSKTMMGVSSHIMKITNYGVKRCKGRIDCCAHRLQVYDPILVLALNVVSTKCANLRWYRQASVKVRQNTSRVVF
jgi:hypothetical protein